MEDKEMRLKNKRKNMYLTFLKSIKRNYYPSSICDKVRNPVVECIFLLIQTILAVFGCIVLKRYDNFDLFFKIVLLIYINVFAFATYEWCNKKKKMKQFGGKGGAYSEKYLHKAKMAILLGIAMTVGAAGNFIVRVKTIDFHIWQQYYWIWLVILLFVGMGVRYLDIVNVYTEEKYMSGNYIVHFDELTDIKITDRRMSNRGYIFFLDIYKDNSVIGFDKVFKKDIEFLKKGMQMIDLR